MSTKKQASKRLLESEGNMAKGKRPEDIKVVVEFTDGYVQRFTKACIEVAKARVEREEAERKAAKAAG